MFTSPVQLTTSRIGDLTRLIHTLAICDGHTYIHTYIACQTEKLFYTVVKGACFLLMICKQRKENKNREESGTPPPSPPPPRCWYRRNTTYSKLQGAYSKNNKNNTYMARRTSRDVSTCLLLGATQVSVRLVPVRDFFGSSTRPTGVASQVLRFRVRQQPWLPLSFPGDV